MRHPGMPLGGEEEVGRVARPASDPVVDVMALGPGGGPVAARPAASFVADTQRASLRRRDDSSRAADVDHCGVGAEQDAGDKGDRKSTRLNSSHQIISYAVFCLKNKILWIVR